MMCGLQGVFCDLQDLKGSLNSVAVSHPCCAKYVAEKRRHILAISIWGHPRKRYILSLGQAAEPRPPEAGSLFRELVGTI
jgi:hypothetical protein